MMKYCVIDLNLKINIKKYTYEFFFREYLCFMNHLLPMNET
jgi:hypothetical protein